MFRFDILHPVFLSYVGFSQTVDRCYPKIHPSLLVGTHKVPAISEVGGMLRNEAIYDTYEGFAYTPTLRAAIPEWQGSDAYEIGERVRYTNGGHEFIYHSTSASNTGNTPAFDSAHWETDLSAFFRQVHQESSVDALAKVVVENHVSASRMMVKEFGPIYNAHTGIQTAERSGENVFHCAEIRLKPIRNLAVKVTRIGVKFDTAQTVRGYVYHSSQNQAIAEFDIVIYPQDAGKFVWKQIVPDDPLITELVLTYMSDDVNSGGSYYIGFYENDVVGDFGQFDAILKMTAGYPYQYLASKRIKATDGVSLPDIGYYLEANAWSDRTALNFQLTTQLDYTYNVQQAPQMFVKYLQYDMAIRLLNYMRNSYRKNTPKANVDEKAIALMLGSSESIINGDTKMFRKGLYAIRETFAKSLKIDLQYNGASPFVTRHI